MSAIELLQSLGVFTIAAAALAWLSRSIASQVLTRDIEKYKSRLEREALEHQIRFARLHDKQAKVLETYYDYLRSARDCIAGFRAAQDSDANARDQNLLNKAIEFCLRAALYHRANELYFHDEISERAKRLELEIVKYSSFSSGVLMMIDETDSTEVSEDRKAMIASAVKGGLCNVEDQITPLLSALRSDFQRYLGVESK